MTRSDKLLDPGEIVQGEIAQWLGQPYLMHPPFSATVSPSHHAVDAETCVIQTRDGQHRYVLKIWHDDLPQPPDGAAVFAMTQAASMLGLTPQPRLCLRNGNGMVMDYLGDNWAPARLHQLSTGDGFERLMSVKRAVHSLAPFPVNRNVFSDIRDLAAKARPIAIHWPQDAEAMLALADQLAQAIAATGVDLVPGHADGIASNIMLGPDGAVQLIDFDEAGNVDPLFDLAVVVNEIFPLDTARHGSALEMLEGQVRLSSSARLTAYRFADDLKWALWGLFMDAASPRRNLEFLKYGQWRWLRCRMATSTVDYQEMIRHV
ncbi:thiamine kinase-like enzyme [Agrobacterium vitis]|nr:thiamine kinase-like enzyme [Agrobacterium vitis]MBE1437943.1 thiamine kinase-like enzyme [Agrobacterium vitis]